MAEILVQLAEQIKQSIERLKAEYPELEDDADLLADTVEGETDFPRVMQKLSAAFLDAATLKEANASFIASLRERGERFDRKADAYRALMLDLMTASGQRKLVLATATLSIAKGRDTLQLDEDFNAQGYMRVVKEPMKTDILAALKAGDDIPGARLVAAPEHLSIRTK